MEFSPSFWTTVLGSFPNQDDKALSEHLIRTLNIPDWPQLPRRTYRENMYVQYSPSIPAITENRNSEKVTFDTTGDLTTRLEGFYEHFLAEDLDAFKLKPEYAAGFFSMLEAMKAVSTSQSRDVQWIKGQVTGPISFGLTVTDQDLRASLYNEVLADVIIKNMAMNARWQVQQLKKVCPNVIIFVDEPYLASFGSAYINLSREQVIAMLDEVFTAIHSEKALAGVHCCGNTDWSVLLATQVDILNLDAYNYLDYLALYPMEIREFLDRGGIVAWGCVPNNDEIYKTTPEGLAARLRDGLKLICQKAGARGVKISIEEFNNRSLIAPSCGLGSTSIEVADRVLKVLTAAGEILKQG
jgi:methionine synthase II (cobalamin-independent)